MSHQHTFKIYLLKRGYSNNTITTYTTRVNRFLKWLKTVKTEILNTEYRHITRYIKFLRTKDYKQSSIQMELSAITHYFNALKEQSLVKVNPAANLTIKNSKQQNLHTILSAEELSELYKSYKIGRAYEGNLPPQQTAMLARQRNKVITGLLVFQGLSVTDIQVLQVTDIKLKDGLIQIPDTRKYAARVLQLQSQQMYDLMQYTTDTRKSLIQLTGKTTQQLFISTGKSNSLHNSIIKLTANLKAAYPKLNNLNQIRASVIVQWLKEHNLRKAQYLAGHKHITATEAYRVYVTDQLADNIEQFHPLKSILL